MNDGRRHSVDIPISRALVALRRVKSLRDPSTSSLSNLNWETNSNNAIVLNLGSGSDHNALTAMLKESRLNTEDQHDFNLPCRSRKSRLISCDNSDHGENTDTTITRKRTEAMHNGGSNEEICVLDTRTQVYSTNCRDRGLPLTYAMPSTNHCEDVDSCSGSETTKKQSVYKNQAKTSGVVRDVVSRTGSARQSTDDALSSFSTSLFANEEIDVFDNDNLGCGIGCCWARTPRSRESNPSSDTEDNPLLSRNLDEPYNFRHRNWKQLYKDVTLSSGTPRSLSQKFRPKYFNELVGQDVITRSLMGALCTGRIASFYLFHGPCGTGKSSTSRIFAAALNCLSLEGQKPCGLCRECNNFFSDKNKDVKEVDSTSINQSERVKSLIKNAMLPPVSSRYKVFIIEECHLLSGETWATILNSIDKLPRHVAFVLITSDLDKLPQSIVTRSQKYHFSKIKDVDIASRLQKICSEEGLEFEQLALDYVAAKSNGSLREAEMMLDQLSLLGKKITMPLTYELMGIVSEEELLDLLDLALSADTSNTVVRARELMRSKVDPMQLMSQLANLIMDIVAGEYNRGCSESRQKFSRKHNSEGDMEKLTHALKILSETEKQLKVAKNQTTWLTVALLHLSSEPSFLDANDFKLSSRTARDKDGDYGSTTSTAESLKQRVTCSCNDCKEHKLGLQENCNGTLESVWKRAIELCPSSSLKNFLIKQGKLSSVCQSQGMAVIELEFQRPSYVSRAEKSWKLIASSLQSILGCSVEIRINLLLSPDHKGSKVKRSILSWFSCSRQKRHFDAQCGSDSENPDYASEKPMITDSRSLNCSSEFEKVSRKALRNSEGNLLSTGKILFHKSRQLDTSKEPGSNFDCKVLSVSVTHDNSSYLSRNLNPETKLHLLETSNNLHSTDNQQEKILPLSICDTDPYVFCPSSNTCSIDCNDEHSRVPWRTQTLPTNKALHQKNRPKRSALIRLVLPCAAAK